MRNGEAWTSPSDPLVGLGADSGGMAYFFFDIDGTLIPGTGNHEVPADTRLALKQLEAEGNFLAIATGREHCLAVPEMEQLGFRNMVSDGGYGVTVAGELLGIDPLDDTQACFELARECDAQGIPWAYDSDDIPERLTASQLFHDLTDAPFQGSVVIPDLDITREDHVNRMFVAIGEGREEKTLPALRNLPWMRYGGANYIYVEPMDKARGIRRILERFDAEGEDVVVFGDSLNDMSMFLPEWTRVAMGNACEELKRKASFVTTAVDDDGIGVALRHYGWIQ